MTPEQFSNHELFVHVRIVLGIVIGLGITRTLTGVAVFVQHPGRHRASLLHLLWAGSMLLELILFWWWEIELVRVTHWTFGVFLFLIGYAIVLYLLAALLFPDNISEYQGYEDFFIRRRNWFFGLMAIAFVLDIVDTLIKGAEHWNRLSQDYLFQVPIGLAMCLVAVLTANRRVHIGVVIINIGYQGYLMARIVTATP